MIYVLFTCFRRSCSNCYGFPVGSSCYWLPVIEVLRDTNVDEGLLPDTVNQLVPYLRVAYCESVCMDLRWPRPGLSDKHRRAARGTVFGDLAVSNTFVNVLTVCVEGPRDALCKFRFLPAIRGYNYVNAHYRFKLKRWSVQQNFRVSLW